MQRLNLPVSGDLLKETARSLWTKIPAYKGQPCPNSFSNGYIDGFKIRYKIKRYKKFGESESAPLTLEQAESRMEEIREIQKQFPPCDQFNCDESHETGLFESSGSLFLIPGLPQSSSMAESLKRIESRLH